MPKLKDKSKQPQALVQKKSTKRGEEIDLPKKKKKQLPVETEERVERTPEKKETELKKKRKLLAKKRKALIEPVEEKNDHVEKKRKKSSSKEVTKKSSKPVPISRKIPDTPPPASPPASPISASPSPSPVKVKQRSRSTRPTVIESNNSGSLAGLLRRSSPVSSRSKKRFDESELMSDSSLRIIKAKVSRYSSVPPKYFFYHICFKDDAYDMLLEKYNHLASQKRTETAKLLHEISQAGKKTEKSKKIQPYLPYMLMHLCFLFFKAPKS